MERPFVVPAAFFNLPAIDEELAQRGLILGAGFAPRDGLAQRVDRLIVAALRRIAHGKSIPCLIAAGV